eukprot:TRINITY_DN24143_c0_g1_i1.p1 TRINITY_DN24143_c0_g1~~TRINITY_DN24143_c0_g1_i1.p1  ORF type:complete len:668 (+),score=177.89 TRINITY_DN24143_c0_g1_i1:184-2187(+)
MSVIDVLQQALPPLGAGDGGTAPRPPSAGLSLQPPLVPAGGVPSGLPWSMQLPTTEPSEDAVMQDFIRNNMTNILAPMADHIRDLQRHIYQLTESGKAVEAKVERSRQEVVQVQHEFGQLRATQAVTDSRLDQTKVDLSCVQRERDVLAGDHDSTKVALDKSNTRVSNVDAAVKLLQQQLQHLDNNFIFMQMRIDKADEVVESHTKSLKILEDSIEAVSNRELGTAGRVGDMVTSMDTLEHDIRKLRKLMESESTARKTALSELEDRIVELEKNVSVSKTDIVDLIEKTTELRTDVDEVKECLDMMDEAENTLMSGMAEAVGLSSAGLSSSPPVSVPPSGRCSRASEHEAPGPMDRDQQTGSPLPPRPASTSGESQILQQRRSSVTRRMSQVDTMLQKQQAQVSKLKEITDSQKNLEEAIRLIKGSFKSDRQSVQERMTEMSSRLQNSEFRLDAMERTHDHLRDALSKADEQASDVYAEQKKVTEIASILEKDVAQLSERMQNDLGNRLEQQSVHISKLHCSFKQVAGELEGTVRRSLTDLKSEILATNAIVSKLGLQYNSTASSLAGLSKGIEDTCRVVNLGENGMLPPRATTASTAAPSPLGSSSPFKGLAQASLFGDSSGMSGMMQPPRASSAVATYSASGLTGRPSSSRPGVQEVARPFTSRT